MDVPSSLRNGYISSRSIFLPPVIAPWRALIGALIPFDSRQNFALLGRPICDPAEIGMHSLDVLASAKGDFWGISRDFTWSATESIKHLARTAASEILLRFPWKPSDCLTVRRNDENISPAFFDVEHLVDNGSVDSSRAVRAVL
jgi:hypothetical protein